MEKRLLMRHGILTRLSGRAAVCGALAALVFFSRAWLIRDWGSPLPFWDQWDAEAIGLYSPWLNGTLNWHDLFRSHNEHPIFLTRVTDLVLFVAYGGWNPWAQLLLNAALHAGTAAALVALFWLELPPRIRPFFVAGVALLFTSTCGWQNALFGFQSQVYFANLFAVGAIAGLSEGTPFRFRWWLGFISATLAFFSNGGGILAAVAVLIVGGVFTENARGTWRGRGALGLIAIAVAIAVLFGSHVPQHIPFHAQNISQFLAVFAHCLSWPWVNQWGVSFILQLPLVWLGLDRWRQREPLTETDRCALAFGLFGVLQAAAIAYSRGAALPDARPLSRYQDPLLLGVVGQSFALLLIFSRAGRAGRLAGLIWGGVAVGGLIGLTETNFTLHLPFKRAQDRANLAIVRVYAAHGDAAAFESDPVFHGPHPDPRVVQRIINDPVLRATLPAEVLSPEGNPMADRAWMIEYSPGLTAASGASLLILLILSARQTRPGTKPSI